jgi:perosamine synthetase
MIDMDAVRAFAERHDLWIVEDAAHAFPAAWRSGAGEPWTSCGANTADVTCFSFYANKTITTGEGGMAVTSDAQLAETIRSLSLHGLSHDAWSRYSGGGSWDYQILSPGYKYNMTDTAAALGIQQLARAEELRRRREAIATAYSDAFAAIPEVETPTTSPDRLHSWHLYPIRCRAELLDIDRNTFICELKDRGIGCSVHWRPLHLHPYYRDVLGWHAEDCPVATEVWQSLISLPIFPEMCQQELERVVNAVRAICGSHRRGAAPQRDAEAALAVSDRAV